MFNCRKYEYVDREVFLRGCLSLYRTTWQVYMANCLYQYIFKCHIAVCSQQRHDETTASRGISKVFSRGKNNVPKNKDHPLPYCLASIPLWCRQGINRQCWHGPIGNSVHIWRLSSIFLYIKMSPDATGSNCDCFVTHSSLLEIEVVSLSSIVAFFVASQKKIWHVRNFLAIVKFHWDLIFVRHRHDKNKIRPEISITKYLSDENYRLYGIQLKVQKLQSLSVHHLCSDKTTSV